MHKLRIIFDNDPCMVDHIYLRMVQGGTLDGIVCFLGIHLCPEGMYLDRRSYNRILYSSNKND